MTIASLLVLAAEEAEHTGNVALETVIFGIVSIVVFGALALVTLSYRNVANRHANKADAYAASHAHEVQRAGHGH
ncbi:hypothetical protein NQ152_09685 [Microbacterium sp. zg.B48]|uniref:hypothetical protein n=1 Tax=unclassified Microbacterium TaxID=2609290 RepID=UPI00214A92CF|nr:MULTISPECIES: hypothetical protein [unclassified Microbacterium]MCR2763778.1 hypothetical protein [Microbacterium sp. zg.B48]MCR2809497.1 hypothetical protein [Microbacterium sp. zg.B185]WIM20631.1 hypothetical protein QNO12_07520 [Microbacterium sp. zg-B185]